MRTRSRWMHPLEAVRPFVRLFFDPDDLQAAERLRESLDGPFFNGWFRRFVETRVGQRVLAEERDLLGLLADRSWLASLPEGSLGRVFLEAADMQALALERAAVGDVAGLSAEVDGMGEWRQRFANRLQDQHELQRVVTGYRCDPEGRAALLAFDLGQRLSPAHFVLLGFASRGLSATGWREVFDAFGRGRRAAWLPAADWEGLLELPLDDVRALLRVGPQGSRIGEIDRETEAA